MSDHTRALEAVTGNLSFSLQSDRELMKGGRDGVTDESGLEKPQCYPGKDGMKTIQGACWEEMSTELMRE